MGKETKENELIKKSLSDRRIWNDIWEPNGDLRDNLFDKNGNYFGVNHKPEIQMDPTRLEETALEFFKNI